MPGFPWTPTYYGYYMTHRWGSVPTAGKTVVVSAIVNINHMQFAVPKGLKLQAIFTSAGRPTVTINLPPTAARVEYPKPVTVKFNWKPATAGKWLLRFVEVGKPTVFMDNANFVVK